MAAHVPERLAVGVMTGTSIDGIDAALIALGGRGLEMTASLLAHRDETLGALGAPLARAAAQEPMTAAEFATLATELGRLHADVIGRLLESCRDAHAARGLDLIAVHGQTIFHQPPISWQLINPAPIAARFGCPVVFDLRQADLAAGGQGAPITPLADWILFRHATKRRAIVNLGGFCNVTVLPPGQSQDPLRAIAGFDVCACNQVLDAVARAALGTPYDKGGRAAASGRPAKHLSDELLDVLRAQRGARRSLGSADVEAAEWARRGAAVAGGADLAASAADAVAGCIGETVIAQGPDEVIVAGGGARNQALLERLRRTVGAPLVVSDEFGVPISAREAMAIAILGGLSADGIAITLPQVTGCTDPAQVAGSWILPRGMRGRA